MADKSSLKYYDVWTDSNKASVAKQHISDLLGYMDYAKLKIIKSDIESSSSWVADSKTALVKKLENLINDIAGFRLQLGSFETTTQEVGKYIALREQLINDEQNCRKEITVYYLNYGSGYGWVKVGYDQYKSQKSLEKKTAQETVEDPIIIARINNTIGSMKSIESFVDSRVNKGGE